MSLQTAFDTSFNTSNEERRKHIRHAIRLFAKIKFETLGTFPCEIKDFCVGGLALDISTADAPNKSALLNAWLYQRAELEFFSPHLQQSFHSRVRVVRATESNIGVSFEETPAVVLDALHQHLNLTQAEQSKQTLTALHTQAHNTEKNSRKKPVCDAVNQFSVGLIKHFFDHIQNSLFDNAATADNNADQMAFYEINTDLQIKKRSIEVEFNKLLLSQIERCFESTSTIIQKTETARSLALVDINEFEDWLNLSDIILQCEAHFQDELHELAQRLSGLLDYTVDDKNNPVAPAMLCEIFRGTIEDLTPNLEIRNTLFRTFDEALKTQLGELYQTLNSLLFDVKIPQAVVSHPTTAEDTPPANETEHEEITAATDPSVEAGDNTNYRAPYAATAEKDNLYQAASHLLNLCRQSRQTQDSPSPPRRSEDTYSTQQLVDLLDSMDLPTHVDSSTDADNAISDDIGAFWQTLSQQGVSSDLIREEDRNSLDIANKIYSNIQHRTRSVKSSHDSFQKLRGSLAKMALQDPSFLNAQTHPVRSVFNQVDRLSAGIEEQNDAIKSSLIEQLSDILQRIEHSANKNPAAFSEISDELEQVIKPLNRRRTLNIQNVIEKAEGKERIRLAKRNVNQALKRRISDKRVPSALLGLLNAGWKQLLFRSDLRDGQGGMAEQVYLDTLDQLLALFDDRGRVKQKDTSEQSENLTTVPVLLNYIYDELSTVCADTSRLDKVMKDLTELFNNPDDSTHKTDIVKVTSKHFDSADEAETTLPASWKQWDAMIEAVKVGQWFRFADLDQHPVLNLAWINENKTHFIFVSREGFKKKELTRHQFAEALRQGTISHNESLDTPLMDQATDEMMQDMLGEATREATHDALTDLINRKEFIKHLKQELAEVKEDESTHVLSCLEIDQVRIISNACGHNAIDQLLSEVVELLQNQYDTETTIAKLGDARFGILSTHCSLDQAQEKATQLLKSIKDFQFNWEDKSYSPGFNIGLIEMSKHTNTVENLLKQGDVACLESKKAGRNNIHTYDQDDKRSATQQEVLEWTGHFDKVLRENQLFLRGQQIKPVSDASGPGHYEILLGVKDKAGKVISPENFILAAELCRRMPEVDRWVIGSAFSWILQHRQEFNAMDGFSINLSGQSVVSQEILEFIQSQFATTGIPPKQITFEITETAAIHDVNVAISFIQKLKRLGCTFSLDDFGSGFSSYAYLKQMDVDYLKIDGMFVKDLDHSQADYAMVKSMNEIGHSLGLKTIAEYVENGIILKKLIEIGVDFVQGYGIRKPAHLDELIKEGV